MKYDRLPWELRFKLKIWQRGDCWEWRGTRINGGYGLFGMGSPSNQAGGAVSAHRMAYEMAKGTIPPGYEIDHICRHTWCVRPSHLEAVSPRTNTLRSDNPAAKNHKKTKCSNCAGPYSVGADGHRFCATCKAERDRAWFKSLSPEKRAQRNAACMDWYYRRPKDVAAD